jgi:hypothetical protein
LCGFTIAASESEGSPVALAMKAVVLLITIFLAVLNIAGLASGTRGLVPFLISTAIHVFIVICLLAAKRLPTFSDAGGIRHVLGHLAVVAFSATFFLAVFSSFR